MDQRKPTPYKLGDFVMGTDFKSANGKILLRGLPPQVQKGAAVVVALELVCAFVLTQAATTAKVKSHHIHRMMDWSAEMPFQIFLTNRLGWHDPLRSMLAFGKIRDNVVRDIAANGGGSPVTGIARTVRKWWVAGERKMRAGGKFRALPSSLLEKGWLNVNVKTAATSFTSEGATATLQVTGLTVTVIAHLIDVHQMTEGPFRGKVPVPLPTLVDENYAPGLTEVKPTPGTGRYLRCSIVRDAAEATAPEDLVSITKLNFGTSGRQAQINRYVDQLTHQWNEENALDPHRIDDVPSATQNSEFRMIDPIENHDGKVKCIPLVWPEPGQDVFDMPSWEGKAPPVLELNDLNRAGLPASLDFLYDRFVGRKQEQLKWMLDTCGASHYEIAPAYADAQDKSLAPLIAYVD
jgi:hypothetical protein